MSFKKAKAVANLVRWYAKGEGNKDNLYKGITQKTIFLKNNNPNREKVKVYCYYPVSSPLGGYLLTPGLHPLGADHPRMHDFAMMLCSLGYIVYNPHIQDYSKLYIVKETLDDYFTVFDNFIKESKLPITAKKIHIFSISFGSFLSLRLASNQKRLKQVASVTIFGGFGSWRSTCETIMSGIFPKSPNSVPADIRSVPAIYNHLIEYIPGLNSESQSKIKKAWLKYMKETWMDDLYLERDRCLQLAFERAKDFSGLEAKVFLLGLGAHKDCYNVYKEIMEQDKHEYLNPLLHSKDITCSVYLIHGKHDELIPAEQQKIIKEKLPKNVIKRAFLTKLYAHSQKAKTGSLLTQLLSFISEIRNMIRIILTLSLPKSQI